MLHNFLGYHSASTIRVRVLPWKDSVIQHILNLASPLILLNTNWCNVRHHDTKLKRMEDVVLQDAIPYCLFEPFRGTSIFTFHSKFVPGFTASHASTRQYWHVTL
jgi:hypothetical protein